jgi:hypothetical protein
MSAILEYCGQTSGKATKKTSIGGYKRPLEHLFSSPL